MRALTPFLAGVSIVPGKRLAFERRLKIHQMAIDGAGRHTLQKDLASCVAHPGGAVRRGAVR
jgi:hypothetical protein